MMRSLQASINSMKITYTTQGPYDNTAGARSNTNMSQKTNIQSLIDWIYKQLDTAMQY